MEMLVFYVSVVYMWTAVMCRFVGDSCIAEGDVGTCTDLSECGSLMAAIKAAGSPMPHCLANRLRRLNCGYNSFSPLVCCTDHKRLFINDNEVPNRKKPPPEDPPSVWGSDAPVTPNQATDNTVITRDSTDPVIVENHPELSKLPKDCGTMDSFRISGGNRTALYEMPWMVLLAYNASRGLQLNCGGTLISDRYVLTAAHCVEGTGDRLVLDHVVLGEWDLDQDPDCERFDGEDSCAPRKMDVGIASVTPHPGYRPQTLVDDIALIRLAEPADFTLDTIAPICLPTTRALQTADLVGETGVVAGWGITELGIQSNVLLSVRLPIISNKKCTDIYRGSPRVYEKQMCAGGEPGKDSCGGDSGGPLMLPGNMKTGGIKYVQRGVVSYGSSRCGAGGFPGVYTNIAFYMDWILNNMS